MTDSFFSRLALASILSLGACGTAAESQPTPPASVAPVAAAPVVVYARVPSDAPSLGGVPVLPQPSPHAMVEQVVGVTTLRLDYSSPAVNGREIWGGLVPYDHVWRAGANAPTRLEITEASTIFGTAVPAGAYTLFVIPTATDWTIILNRDSQGRGFQGYDQAEDVARGTVTPTDAPVRERLAYTFDDTTDHSTSLVLDWAGKRAAMPITIDTPALVSASIDATLAQAWRPYFNAGRYYLDQHDDDRAIDLLTRSQAIQATWWNEWFLARALDAAGRRPEAIPHAQHAQELGAGDTTFDNNFAEPVRAALAEWH
jgi:hypothetical protein